MRNAARYREAARNVLRGKWKSAVLARILASLTGAGIAVRTSVNWNKKNTNRFLIYIERIQETELGRKLLIVLIIGLIIFTFWMIVTLFINGAVRMGSAIFNLKLADGENAEISDLFSQLHRWIEGLFLNLLTSLYVVCWMMLMVIPGIMKWYSYALAPYILAENPYMGANEVITESQQIIDGNRWGLVLLGFEFLGMATSLLNSVPDCRNCITDRDYDNRQRDATVDTDTMLVDFICRVDSCECLSRSSVCTLLS